MWSLTAMNALEVVSPSYNSHVTVVALTFNVITILLLVSSMNRSGEYENIDNGAAVAVGIPFSIMISIVPSFWEI